MVDPVVLEQVQLEALVQLRGEKYRRPSECLLADALNVSQNHAGLQRRLSLDAAPSQQTRRADFHKGLLLGAQRLLLGDHRNRLQFLEGLVRDDAIKEVEDGADKLGGSAGGL